MGHRMTVRELSLVVGAVIGCMATMVTATEDSGSRQATPAIAPAPVRPHGPEDDVRAELNGTQWAIELRSLSTPENAKTQKDTIRFEADSKISSDRFAKGGYPQSNYTLTIGDDGVPVWETMQTKEGEGVMFWRGECHGSIMRGVVSKHPLEGATEDLSFVGREASGKTISGSGPQPTEASGVAAAERATTSAHPAEPPKKKKKRGGTH